MTDRTITVLTVSALITLSYVFLIAFALWCLRVVAAPVLGFPTVVVYVLQGLVLMVFSWGAAALRDLADTVFDIIATMVEYYRYMRTLTQYEIALKERHEVMAELSQCGRQLVDLQPENSDDTE